ncbi:hypothetical protein BDY21DRAFT_332283 [Lineolata rhizophorae]|uniref:Uncharacterized protein n=1 Tax=Lineolata rhizophorae TaxID=578093 RepID=A0A6A6PDH8_9PEZI|nr:hypothetical protein BDY21DRAFT_332283 [Lineolata rhizophorae]
MGGVLETSAAGVVLAGGGEDECAGGCGDERISLWFFFVFPFLLLFWSHCFVLFCLSLPALSSLLLFSVWVAVALALSPRTCCMGCASLHSGIPNTAALA